MTWSVIFSHSNHSPFPHLHSFRILRILPSNTSLFNTYFSTKVMAPRHRSLSPTSTADNIRPQYLWSAQYTSNHSHMNHEALYNPSMKDDAHSIGDAKIAAEDNRKPRFELFLLGDGEKKVSEEADTRKCTFFLSSKATDICYSYTRLLTTSQSLSSITNSHPCAVQIPA